MRLEWISQPNHGAGASGVLRKEWVKVEVSPRTSNRLSEITLYELSRISLDGHLVMKPRSSGKGNSRKMGSSVDQELYRLVPYCKCCLGLLGLCPSKWSTCRVCPGDQHWLIIGPVLSRDNSFSQWSTLHMGQGPRGERLLWGHNIMVNV